MAGSTLTRARTPGLRQRRGIAAGLVFSEIVAVTFSTLTVLLRPPSLFFPARKYDGWKPSWLVSSQRFHVCFQSVFSHEIIAARSDNRGVFLAIALLYCHLSIAVFVISAHVVGSFKSNSMAKHSRSQHSWYNLWVCFTDHSLYPLGKHN